MDTSFSNSNRLLLHCFMNSNLIRYIHLIEFIYSAYSLFNLKPLSFI